jgi:hypothetical protein
MVRARKPSGKRLLAPTEWSRLRQFEAMMKADAPKPQPMKQAHDGAPAPLMISFDDLADNHCRWPCGDPRDPAFGFCGHEKERGSYCSFHAALAYAGRPMSLATRPMRRAA